MNKEKKNAPRPTIMTGCHKVLGNNMSIDSRLQSTIGPPLRNTAKANIYFVFWMSIQSLKATFDIKEMINRAENNLMNLGQFKRPLAGFSPFSSKQFAQ